MMHDDLWETGEPEPFAPAPTVRRAPLLCYLVAAVFVGVFIAGFAYYTANLIPMAMLTQALGQ